jgi:hypothetical protein
MTPNSPRIRPPFIARWLIRSFTSGWQEDAILGDLLEEFSELASKSGLTYARRWYWQQSIKTLGALISAGFRTTPWLIASAVVGGYLVLRFGFSVPEKLIVAVLEFRRHGIIPYYTQSEMAAYLFWLNTGILIGRLLVSVLTGCIIAILAKGREMITTLMLTIFLFALNVMAWFNMARYWPERAVPLPIALTNLANIILIPTGGVIVRQVRSLVAGRHLRM